MVYDYLRRIPLALMVCVFLALDFGLLFVNVNLTRELSHDTLLINITGRQRMLSQRIAKDLLLVTTPAVQQNLQHQQLTQALLDFDQTLAALSDGGEVSAPDGNRITLTAITDPTSQQLLQQAKQLWRPVNSMVLRHLAAPDSAPNSQLIEQFARYGSNELLTIMNQLTVRAEQISKINARHLRLAQLCLFLLLLSSFFLILIRLRKEYKFSRRSQLQFERLAQKVHEAIFLLDERQQLLFKNHAAETLLTEHKEYFAHRPLLPWLYSLCAENYSTVQLHNRHYSARHAKLAFIPNDIFMISLLDVTEKMTLHEYSTTDPLTGLLNRRGLELAYDQMCQKTPEITCLFIDLDRFKAINDNYGHAAGDAALMAIGHRLRSCVKDIDIIARIGGDEFTVVLVSPPTADATKMLVGRIKATLKQPIQINNQLHCSIGASIGIAVSTQPHDRIQRLLAQADKKMYCDKHAKRQTDVKSPTDSGAENRLKTASK